MKTRFILLMGVSGSGKTTIGKALSKELGWDFFDADDFHPQSNIDKMANEIPLTDKDRAPWLAALRELIQTSQEKGQFGILVCSALKESYRQELISGDSSIQIIFLKGDFDLISARLANRSGHYMKPVMLQSQFDALEEPKNVISIDISNPVESIVEHIIKECFKN